MTCLTRDIKTMPTTMPPAMSARTQLEAEGVEACKPEDFCVS